jgi:hypothetical protein
VLRGALDEIAEQMQETPQPVRLWALVAGGSLSAAYVLWNVRALYALLSLVLTTPLWRQYDVLAVLDAWDKDGRKRPGRPGGRDNDDDDEALRPILG